MKKVLILYGTRYGSTKEISQEIEKVLRENDIEVLSVNIEDKREIPILEKFDGVLIGSSIKMGKMTKHIRKFIDKKADKLQNRENVLGVFISCGTAGEEGKRPKAKQDYIESILKEKNLNADIYDAFGGVFDLTEDSNIGFLSKKILKMMAREDPNITPGQKNDQRNWEYIREFANKFCSQLTAK